MLVDVSSGGSCSGVEGGCGSIWEVFLVFFHHLSFCFFVRVSQLSGLFGVSVRASCASLSRIGDLVMLCGEDGLQFWGLVGLSIFSGRLGGWVLSWRGHESVLSMGGSIFNLVPSGYS